MQPAPLGKIDDFIPWARNIGRQVAKAYGFLKHSQEEEDVISAAYLRMVDRWAAFEPERGTDFRGFARRDVMSECQREARRLRNGGTYNTRREEPGVSLVVQIASTMDNADGEPMDIVDYRAAPEYGQASTNTKTMPELMALLRG